MSLKALRTLRAIARHGTFARAADAVGLTQSAVSLQVKALEDEFGAQLFDRTRRQPTLTEAGRIVLARAEEVLALYDRIPDALSDEHGGPPAPRGRPDRPVRPGARRAGAPAPGASAAEGARRRRHVGGTRPAGFGGGAGCRYHHRAGPATPSGPRLGHALRGPLLGPRPAGARGPGPARAAPRS